VGVPTVLSYFLAPHLFGDAFEYSRIQMFHSFYKKEFKNYKNELYYA
jgi:hypothetical protein